MREREREREGDKDMLEKNNEKVDKQTSREI